MTPVLEGSAMAVAKLWSDGSAICDWMPLWTAGDGASVTSSVKVSEVALPSDAVTVISVWPRSELAGVPKKVKAMGSKVSHAGSALVVYAMVELAVNVPGRSAKSKGWSTRPTGGN